MNISFFFNTGIRPTKLSLTMSDNFYRSNSRLDLGLDDWKKYALFEHMKNYTRNLIATDNATFTLLLLCWNPDKESPIHDHPCDGCWLRVCEGRVRETRYEIDEVTDSLEITSDETFESESNKASKGFKFHIDVTKHEIFFFEQAVLLLSLVTSWGKNGLRSTKHINFQLLSHACVDSYSICVHNKIPQSWQPEQDGSCGYDAFVLPSF